MEQAHETTVQREEAKTGDMANTEIQGQSKRTLLEKIRGIQINKQNKRLIIFWLIVIVIFGTLYYFKGVFIAATVNGSPVSRWSVITELEKKAGKGALDTIITKKLIQNEMRRLGVIVKDEDVSVAMGDIEAQLTAQGLTLDQALAEQGMTTGELREQLMINKGLEQILADKVAVSDEEINEYLSANSAFFPKGTSSDDQKKQAQEQLKSQKFNTEASQWVSDLRAKADIRYYTQY